MAKNKEIGTKNDKDKLRIDLIPIEAITALASVLKNGADKYGENNWCNGIRYTREWSAAQRHLWAWFDGETIDKDSGLNHLWHALGAVTILIALSERGMEDFDDRPVMVK